MLKVKENETPFFFFFFFFFTCALHLCVSVLKAATGGRVLRGGEGNCLKVWRELSRLILCSSAPCSVSL